MRKTKLCLAESRLIFIALLLLLVACKSDQSVSLVTQTPEGETLARISVPTETRILPTPTATATQTLIPSATPTKLPPYTPTWVPTITPTGFLASTATATQIPVSISPTTRLGNGYLQVIKWSPDAKKIVVGTSFGIFVLNSYDFSTQSKLETGKWVHNLAIHPGGNIITTGGDSQYPERINLWDPQNGMVVNTLRGIPGDGITAVDFSPDGTMLVSGTNNGKVQLWNLSEGRLLRNLLESPQRGERFIQHVQFSRDGSHIIVGDHNETVRLFKVETGQLVTEINNHFRYIKSLSISPDNMKIVVAGDLVLAEGESIRQSGAILFNANDGEIIYQMESIPLGSINFVLFSPDNLSIVVGSCQSYSRYTERCIKGLLQKRDSENGDLLQVIKEYASDLVSGSYSPDGKFIAVITSDLVPLIEIWDSQSNKLLRNTEWYIGPLKPVMFTPDSKSVISHDPDGKISFWNTETGTLISTLGKLQDEIGNVTLRHDGKVIASSGPGGSITLWDINSGQVSGKIQTTKGNEFYYLRYTPNDQWLVWLEYDEYDHISEVLLYHLEDQSETTIMVPRLISDFAISPDSSMIAIGVFDDSQDNVLVFDITTGKILWSYQAPDSITSVSFSSDSAILAAGSWDSTILVFDNSSGAFLHKVFAGNKRYQFGASVQVAFFHQEPILVSNVGWEIKLWDITTYESLLYYYQKWSSGDVVSISPDDRIIVINPGDGTTMLWKVNGIDGTNR